MPLGLGAYFIVRNRDPFAGSLMLWSAAAGVMDTAPYIYDAWKPQHVLLTGRTGDTGGHDFIDVLAISGCCTAPSRSAGSCTFSASC